MTSELENCYGILLCVWVGADGLVCNRNVLQTLPAGHKILHSYCWIFYLFYFPPLTNGFPIAFSLGPDRGTDGEEEAA